MQENPSVWLLDDDASIRFVLEKALARVDLAAFVPAARAWPRIRWVRITLAGRHDLITARKLAGAREKLKEMLEMIDDLQAS